MSTKTKNKTIFNELPKRVTRKEFNQFVSPYLSFPKKGPDPKISRYKIFNYILYVLHTGIQWNELKTYKNEIHWSNVYKWHNRWSKDGSYYNLFLGSLDWLERNGQLDLSVLHGDGSNTVAKKGVKESAILDTSTKKEKKPLP